MSCRIDRLFFESQFFLQAHPILVLLGSKYFLYQSLENDSVFPLLGDFCQAAAEDAVLFPWYFGPELVAKEIDALGIETEGAIENPGTIISQLGTDALRRKLEVEAVLDVGIFFRKTLAVDCGESLLLVFFEARLLWIQEENTDAPGDSFQFTFDHIQHMLKMLLDNFACLLGRCNSFFVEGHSEQDAAAAAVSQKLKNASDEFDKEVKGNTPKGIIGFGRREAFLFLEMFEQGPDVGPFDILAGIDTQDIPFEAIIGVTEIEPFAGFKQDSRTAVIRVFGDKFLGPLFLVFSRLV